MIEDTTSSVRLGAPSLEEHQPTFRTARRAFYLTAVVLILSIAAILGGLVALGIVGIVVGTLGVTFATMFAVRAHAAATGRESIL